MMVGWFPNLTRAYDSNGRCPRQKFVFGILNYLLRATHVISQSELPSAHTSICDWLPRAGGRWSSDLICMVEGHSKCLWADCFMPRRSRFRGDKARCC